MSTVVWLSVAIQQPFDNEVLADLYTTDFLSVTTLGINYLSSRARGHLGVIPATGATGPISPRVAGIYKFLSLARPLNEGISPSVVVVCALCLHNIVLSSPGSPWPVGTRVLGMCPVFWERLNFHQQPVWLCRCVVIHAIERVFLCIVKLFAQSFCYILTDP